MIVPKKVLLHIEDDARVAKAIADLLRDAGYHVVTAFSAEDGLRRIPRVRPDLVILDIGMPGMSGTTVLRQLLTPEGGMRIPVLVFTALPALVDATLRAAADGFLVKPADGDALLAEIARILAVRAGSERAQ